MLDQIAKEESGTILPTLTKELDDYHVIRHVNTRLEEIHNDSVTVTTALPDQEPNTFTIPAKKQLPDMGSCSVPLHYVGDCAGERPSNIEHAIKSAYDTANEL